MRSASGIASGTASGTASGIASGPVSGGVPLFLDISTKSRDVTGSRNRWEPVEAPRELFPPYRGNRSRLHLRATDQYRERR